MYKSVTEKAHGRVNLIGEHTDYNGGWVLPTAISQFTEVTLTPCEDKMVRVISGTDPKRGGSRELAYELGCETKQSTWIDYIQGATKILGEAARERGEKITGMRVEIKSTMPEGSGLSSSAALEISFMKAMRSAFNLSFKDVELARLAQRVENEFVGARVGIMDQMACSLAVSGEALFLDTKTLNYEQLKLPLDKMDILIINSGISHQLSASGGYNERRAQCEEACKILGINELRDITLEELEQKTLPDLLMKRATHVVSENARVFAAVNAIKETNLPELGRLFKLSHASMRDDYDVSISEIDLLVELCCKEADVYGARLTGGGFGGSIVAITQKDKAREVAQKVVSGYFEKTGKKATILS
jgi:galactokinase